MVDGVVIQDFNGRKIAIKGIGKMYYQDGFPIEISADMLTEKGVEISWLHVADELLKNQWDANRVYRTLEPILTNSKYEKFLPLVSEFINKEYEDQREMIFQYLFGTSSNDAIKDKSVRDELKLSSYI